MCALVTGVQTCALPICRRHLDVEFRVARAAAERLAAQRAEDRVGFLHFPQHAGIAAGAENEVQRARRLGAGREGAETGMRSEEHTSELQSLIRNPYAVFCVEKTKKQQ